MYRAHVSICLLGIFTFFMTGCLGNEAVVHGSKAGVDQFPFQVSLVIHGKGNYCGGGIIDEQFILTAAHCLIDADGHYHTLPMFVVAGTNDLGRTNAPAITREILKVYVPTDFNPLDIKIGNDIAVVKLRVPLDLKKDNHLKKLKLPKKDKTFYGKTAKVAGFGWDLAGIEENMTKGYNTDTGLKFADVDILRQGQSGHPKVKISDRQICGRVKQQSVLQPSGVCTGDSGSPLVLKEKFVIGILSVSPKGCTEVNFCAIYTSVSHYLKFIKNSMLDKKKSYIHAIDVHY